MLYEKLIYNNYIVDLDKISLYDVRRETPYFNNFRTISDSLTPLTSYFNCRSFLSIKEI